MGWRRSPIWAGITTYKELLFSGVSALALTLGIGAGTVNADETTASPSACAWDGSYAGGHGGVGWTEADAVEVGSGPVPFVDLDGILFGVHVGHNWQCSYSNNVVFGVEADADVLLGMDESVGGGSSAIFGDIDFLAAIRGRLGVVIRENTLLTANAGVAFVDSDQGTATATFSHDVGGVVGVGLEHKVSDNVSFRGDASYYFFGEETFVDTGGSNMTLDLDIFTVRVGLTRHF